MMRLLFLIVCGAATGCNAVRAAETAAAPGLRTLAFDCGTTPLLVVLLADNATVYLPDRGATLTRVADSSAAVTHYSDGYSQFALAGDVAQLNLGDQHFHDCRLNRVRGFWEAAQLRGSSFRAAGPGLVWTLDVLGDSHAPMLRFAPQDGSGTLWFRAVQWERPVRSNSIRYRATSAAHRLTVVITPTAHCESALPIDFSRRVTLTIDGRSTVGCGGSVP